MLTKFVVAFSILALVAAMAGTAPVKGPTHKVTAHPTRCGQRNAIESR